MLHGVDAHSEAPSIEWRSGLLTVHAKDAPRRDVLLQVARLTDTEITGLDNATEPFSIDLTSVPLGTALPALVVGHAYALTSNAPQQVGESMRYELQVGCAHALRPTGPGASAAAAQVAPCADSPTPAPPMEGAPPLPHGGDPHR